MTTTKTNRSAISGRYVTEQYAKTHKSTTVTETNRRPAPKPTPSKPKGK
jgi:hypothetical protein